LEAIGRFLRALPDSPGLAFVIVLHLDPERESSVAALLQRHTHMRVMEVPGTVPIEGDHVYVIPPNRSLRVENGNLAIAEFADAPTRRAAVDAFFRSLATMGDRAVAVVLSGSGSDGALGARAVKEGGGFVLVQEPSDAQHDGMPRSAIRSGVADVVLPVEELARRLTTLEATSRQVRIAGEPGGSPSNQSGTLQAILAELRARTGHDFSRYRRSTLQRRIGRRVRVTGVAGLPEYLGVLQGDPFESRRLIRDLLISVTHFFRDPEAWKELERTIVPTIAERGPGPAGVRVWVPGCATGEEAYTVAMLLLEHGGQWEGGAGLQVFASDMDDEAVAFGRQALYPESIAADLTPERLQTFFQPEGDHLRVRKEVRERVLFASHSLLTHPPFSRVDLITCRNVLIYLERALQEELLRLFHHALRPDGYLFLGSAESAEGPPGLFEPVSSKHRIFRRRSEATVPVRFPAAPALGAAPADLRAGPEAASRFTPHSAEHHYSFLERAAPPSLLVGRDHRLVHLSESAGRYLSRPGGIPSDDVLREVRPELRLDLQDGLARAFESGMATTRGPLRVAFDGDVRWVHLIVRPAPHDDPEHEGLALILFVEGEESLGAEPGLPDGGAQDDPRVQRLRDEVRRLRERLGATIEEYEASKVDRKAADEELQSIHEEYKSTSEELQTSSEELRSMNEELETVNQELKNKVDELSQANSDLRNLMASTDVGTLFLDRELRIQRYTPPVADLFNVMPSDHGRPISDLTRRIDYPGLADDAAHVLRDLASIEREVQGPGGSWLIGRLSPYKTVEGVVAGVVLTLVDITRRKEAEDGLRSLTATLEQRVAERTAELRTALELFHRLFHASPVPMVMTRMDDRRFVDANGAYLEYFGVTREELEGSTDVMAAQWQDASSGGRIMDDLRGGGHVRNVESHPATRSGMPHTALTFVERIDVEGGPHLLSIFVDITSQKAAQERIRTLASALAVTEHRERRRVAELLHDDLQQRLYSIKYRVASIAEMGAAQPWDEVMERLRHVEDALDGSIDATRQLTVDLSPPILEGEGLTEALSWLVSRMEEMHGLRVSLVSDKRHQVRDPDTRLLLVQTVRELLFNAVKHSGTQEATIRLSEQDGLWVVEVADEGRGFDPTALEELPPEEGGFGLRSLRYRLGLFGGRLEVDSQPGQGTRVIVTLPVPRSDLGEEPPPPARLPPGG
jgi:two-component system CheB/CheR fusion protein